MLKQNYKTICSERENTKIQKPVIHKISPRNVTIYGKTENKTDKNTQKNPKMKHNAKHFLKNVEKHACLMCK